MKFYHLKYILRKKKPNCINVSQIILFAALCLKCKSEMQKVASVASIFSTSCANFWAVYVQNLLYFSIQHKLRSLQLGTLLPEKMHEYLEKPQTAFAPPPVSENYVAPVEFFQTFIQFSPSSRPF